jgi:hypothetical protein
VSGSGQVIAKLIQGGLQGYTPENNRTEFKLPNGGNVVILGTHYCVVYDAASGVATVCNFDGTVNYAVAGGDLIALPARSMVIFDGDKVLNLYENLDLTPEDFDRYATEHHSPLAGMDTMQAEYQLPTPPQLLAPGDGSGSGTTPALRWDPVENVSGYHLQVAGTPSFSSPQIDVPASSTEWLFPNPLPTGTYYWHVQPLNTFGRPGDWSGTWKFTISPAPAIPALSEPADVQFFTSGMPKFGWGAVEGATRYHIQVSSRSDYSSPEVDLETDGTSWAPPYNLPLNEYYWHVQAINAFDMRSEWSTARRFTISPAPAPPYPLDPGDGQMVYTDLPGFSWQAPAEAAGYTVQVSAYPDFSSMVFTGTPAGTYWATPQRMSTGTYYWRVQAFNRFGTAGEWSAARRLLVNMPPGAPELADPGDGQIVFTSKPGLDWKDVAGVSRYRIQVGPYDDFGKMYYDEEVAGVSWTPVDTLSMGTYFWHVQALNTFETPGPWSPTWKFDVSLRLPAPQLLDPPSGKDLTSTRPTLTWSGVPGAAFYYLQVDDDPSFGSPEVDRAVNGTSWKLEKPLEKMETWYYWRVQAANQYGTPGDWSARWSMYAWTLY